MNATDYLFLIPILPLAGAVINGFLGSRLSPRLVGPIGCAGPVAAFALAALWFFDLGDATDSFFANVLGNWFDVAGMEVAFGFHLDALSSVMVLVVTGVGSLIHMYSIGYMAGDPGYARYFAYLNLFMGSMLLLVLADNLVLMFLGWEGVGLCSYLLIGFWYDDVAKARAGKKAFVVNRIGDFGFAIGMFLIFVTYETFNMRQITGLAAAGVTSSGATIPDLARLWIPLLLFVGATGKSAQIPLHVWLPDAMAGPTPVSALIHAATMVTSGVYMVARLAPVYSAAPEVMTVVAVIGAVTALVAGFIAMSQNDIKKVLAYSTVSQLGYMFLAAGLGAYGIAVFHLTTHAFFKGLLFLGAGAVIHSLHHEQDMRRMGGLRKKLPVTFLLMLTGTLAIAGCPLLAGFYSKDAILEHAMHGEHANLILWAMGAITAVMTSFYMFRLVAMTFLGQTAEEKLASNAGDNDILATDHGATHGPVKESPGVMLAPMGVLAVLSAVGGSVFHGLPGYVHPSPKAEHDASGHGVWEALVTTGGLIGTGLFLAGLGAAWLLFIKKPALRTSLTQSNVIGRVAWRFSSGKIFVDELYHALIIKPLDDISNLLFLLVDRLLIDGLLVSGSGFSARIFGGLLRQIQTGRVPTYAGWFVGGTVVVLLGVLFVLKEQ